MTATHTNIDRPMVAELLNNLNVAKAAKAAKAKEENDRLVTLTAEK